jgi:hypothetical protein
MIAKGKKRRGMAPVVKHQLSKLKTLCSKPKYCRKEKNKEMLKIKVFTARTEGVN